MGIPLNLGCDRPAPGKISRAEFLGVITTEDDPVLSHEEEEKLFQAFLLLVKEMERK